MNELPSLESNRGCKQTLKDLLIVLTGVPLTYMYLFHTDDGKNIPRYLQDIHELVTYEEEGGNPSNLMFEKGIKNPKRLIYKNTLIMLTNVNNSLSDTLPYYDD